MYTAKKAQLRTTKDGQDTIKFYVLDGETNYTNPIPGGPGRSVTVPEGTPDEKVDEEIAKVTRQLWETHKGEVSKHSLQDIKEKFVMKFEIDPILQEALIKEAFAKLRAEGKII